MYLSLLLSIGVVSGLSLFLSINNKSIRITSHEKYFREIGKKKGIRKEVSQIDPFFSPFNRKNRCDIKTLFPTCAYSREQ
jgi:hypothetical protein